MNSSYGGYGRGGGGGGGPGPGPASSHDSSDGSYSTSDGAVYRAPDYEEVTGAEGEVYSPDDEDQPYYAPPPPSSSGGGGRGRGRGGGRRVSRSTARGITKVAATKISRSMFSKVSGGSTADTTAGSTFSASGTTPGSSFSASPTISASMSSSTVPSISTGLGWYAGWGGVWGAGAWGKFDTNRSMKYAKKKGAGGWLYWQYANGDIQIADGPQSVSEAFLPAFKSKAWYAITNEIGAVAGQAPKVAAYMKAHKTGTVGPVSSSEVATTAIGEKKAKGLNALFAALSQGSAAQGKALVGKALEHGPEVAVAAQEYLSERASSPALLSAKIAKYEGKYAQAKAERNAVKAAKYLAKLQGLKARLAALQSGEATTVDASGAAVAPVESAFPWTYESAFPWTYVAVGGGALIVLAMLASSKKGG